MTALRITRKSATFHMNMNRSPLNGFASQLDESICSSLSRCALLRAVMRNWIAAQMVSMVKVLMALALWFLNLDGVAISQQSNVEKLRSELRYPFILDFALNHCSADSIDPNLVYAMPPQSGFSQSFQLNELYSLKPISSFEGDRLYFFLTKHELAIETWYLLEHDSTRAVLIDTLLFWRIGDVAEDTLNGGTIFRVEQHTTGTGFYGHHLFIYAVLHDRFRELFHCYLADLSTWRDTVTRTLGAVSYADINGDGYRDIRYETEEDMLDPTQDINVWNEDELRDAAVLSTLSHSAREFLWNPVTLTFEMR